MSQTGTRNERVERLSRREGPDRSDDMNLDDDPRQPADDQPTPEEALADAHRIIESQNATIAEQSSRLNTAETEAQKARRLATEEQGRALQQQEQNIANAVVAAQTEKESALARLKTARTANDEAAEFEAVDALSIANAKLLNAQNTKASFETWKKNREAQPVQPQPRPQQPAQQDEMTPEARTWLADHPLYYRDENYRADAMASHDAALAKLGRDAEGTKPYVDFIESRMKGLYGEGHGQIDRGRKANDMTQQTRQPQRRTNVAARPDNGGRAVGGAGDFTYTHEDGSRLSLVSGIDANGKPYETVRGTIPAQWREFAKINRMSDVAYAVEQIKIQQEVQDGGLQGLSMSQNGVYR